MTKILGLSGKQGSGKSTLCRFLQRNVRELFPPAEGSPVLQVYHPAQRSKDYLRALFGIDCTNKDAPSGYYWSWKDSTRPKLLSALTPEDHKESISVRQFLEWWGDLVCGINPAGPIQDILTQIQDDQPYLAVIDGIRRIKEVTAIHECGGKVLRLDGGEGTTPWETELFSFLSFDGFLQTKDTPLFSTQIQLINYLKHWEWTVPCSKQKTLTTSSPQFSRPSSL